MIFRFNAHHVSWRSAMRRYMCVYIPLFYWIIPNTKVAMDISRCHHCQGTLAEDANYPSGHNFHSLGRHGRRAVLHRLSSPLSMVEGKSCSYRHRFQSNRCPSQRFWGPIGSYAWVLRNWEVSRVIFRRLLFRSKYSFFFQMDPIFNYHVQPLWSNNWRSPHRTEWCCVCSCNWCKFFQCVINQFMRNAF